MKAYRILFLLSFFFALHIEIKAQCISGDCDNGQGTYVFADAAVYEGEWVNDKQHGQGTFIFTDGTVRKGKWVNGEYIRE